MLIDALENWAEFGLAEKPTLLKEFNGGLNHRCGLIKVGNQQYVTKLFQHSFNQSIRAEHLACEAGIAPRIFSATNNVMVSEYISDSGYSNERLVELCQAIKRTHKISHEGSELFNLKQVLNRYIKNAPDSLLTWHTLLTPLIAEFSQDPTPPVFSHNDLVKENCLFDRQQAWLIDWEFAQLNNPWFDLGSIMLYFELNSSQANQLFEHYFGHTEFDALSRISQLAQLCVLWCDLLWQISKHGHGYIAEARERFDDLAKRAKRLDVELS